MGKTQINYFYGHGFNSKLLGDQRVIIHFHRIFHSKPCIFGVNLHLDVSENAGN